MYGYHTPHPHKQRTLDIGGTSLTVIHSIFTTMAVSLSRSSVCNAALQVLPSLRRSASISFRQTSAAPLSALGSAASRACRTTESRFLFTIASAGDGATAVTTVEEPSKSAEEQKPSLTPEGELQRSTRVNACLAAAQTRPASVVERMACMRDISGYRD